MSRWTGKSDFADWCEMHNNPKDILKNAEIYLANAKVEAKCVDDLIPYYTNLTSSIACSDGHQSIHLTIDSFIDIEETEFLSWRVRDCIYFARKAKKQKVEFTYEWVKDRLVKEFMSSIDEVYKAIVDIINKNPDILKIHIPSDWREAKDVFEEWIVPRYFANIHLPRFNEERLVFLKFCAEHGYKVYSNKIEILEVVEHNSKYHPLLWSMSNKCVEFNKMMEQYGEKQ